MRTLIAAMISLLLYSLVACEKKSASSNPAPISAAVESTPNENTTTTPLMAGSIGGLLLPTEGEAASTVAGASISAVGRPEISAVSGEDGAFQIDGVLPGTLTIIVTSNETALTEGSSQFGLKIDEIVVKAGEATALGEQTLKRTGGLSGQVVFFENPNDLSLEGSDVYIPGTSFIAKTDSQGLFSLAGLPPGKYDLRVQHTGFSVMSLDDVEVLEGEIRALGELSLSLSDGPEGLVNIAASHSLSIGGSIHKVSNSRSVALNLSYDGDAALMKISDEPSFLNCSWLPIADSYTWSFTSDGSKSLYVMYSDLNGLESSPFSDNVIIDTEVPVLSQVTILHNFAQTAQRLVTVDINASDTGTGVAEISFSENPNAFTLWNPFAARMDVELSDINGPKTIYAKVKDYVGNISTILINGNPPSDSIQLALNGSTLIPSGTLTGSYSLRKAQSPYLIANTTILTDNLTLEPGVELYIAPTAMLTVRGVFTAVGSTLNTDRVKIANADTPDPGSLCGDAATDKFPKLLLTGGISGVSNANRVKWADIEYVSLYVNGGQFDTVHFNATNCTSSKPESGVINKSGLDSLAVKNSTFTNWGIAAEVTEGNGNTVYTNNGGTVAVIVRQSDSADNTDMRNNTLGGGFTIVSHDGYLGMVEVDNGSVDLTGTTIVGHPNRTAIYSSNLASPTQVVVKGVHVDVCRHAVKAKAAVDSSILIQDLVVEDCDVGVVCQAGEVCRPITIEDSQITVSDALVWTDIGLNTRVTVQNSEVTCAAASGYCDLSLLYLGMSSDVEVTLAFIDNQITCAASNCRGFSIQQSGGNDPKNAIISLNSWSTNTFIGKQPNANLVGSVTGGNFADLATTTAADIRIFKFDLSTNGASITETVTVN